MADLGTLRELLASARLSTTIDAGPDGCPVTVVRGNAAAADLAVAIVESWLRGDLTLGAPMGRHTSSDSHMDTT